MGSSEPLEFKDLQLPRVQYQQRHWSALSGLSQTMTHISLLSLTGRWEEHCPKTRIFTNDRIFINNTFKKGLHFLDRW